MAKVHTKGPLTILPELFVWDDRPYWSRVQGACLILQVMTALQLQTTLTTEQMAKVVSAYARRKRVPYKGLTLAQTFDLFQPLLDNKRIGARRHQTVDSAIKALCEGGTVIALTADRDNIALDWCNRFSLILEREEVLNAIGPASDEYVHSMIIAGVDKKQNTLIVRETRPTYGHYGSQGFGKLPINALRKNEKALAYVEVVVY